MADKPAPDNQQILEGLWMIGVDPTLYAGVDPKDPNFTQTLVKRGVTYEFLNRAKAGVQWRASDNKSTTVLSQQVASLLRASGYRQDEVQSFLDRANQSGAVDDPKQLLATLTAQFGDRTAGAMMAKSTGGKPPDGASWNPYRTDVPPPNANTQYGGGGQPGVQGAGSAGARVDQPGQLPTPPTPVQQAQKAAQQGIPTTPAAAQPAVQPAAGAGAGAGDKKNDLPTTFIPKSPQEITDFIHKHFGQDAWFMDIPEVSKILLGMAATGNTDGDEAIRQVSNTEWYKGTDTNARQWYADERSDPGTTRGKIADQVTYLQGLAQNEGITIDPARLSALAESSLRYNWKPSQIHAALSAEFKYDPTSTQQASVIGSMKSVASDYMVPLSDQALQSWDKGIATGDYTSAQFTEYVKSVSKSLFPQLSSAIDAGHTVQNYIDPYRQVAAQALDLAPQNIDFMNDPRFRSALEQIDPKTGMKTVMTLGDFQQKIKTDPSYGYDKTTAGINEGASLATQILQKFGKAT